MSAKNERGAGRKPSIPQKDFDLIIERCESGETIASIALEYGVSRQALSKRISAYKQMIDSERQYDYEVDGQLITRIFYNEKSQNIRIINYAKKISRLAFRENTNPDWQAFIDFCEKEYIRLKAKNYYDDVLFGKIKFCCDQKVHDLDFKGKLPQFKLSRENMFITRSSTDGFQLKAVSPDRMFFIKSQAIMAGLRLDDWAVEVEASYLCEQLEIPHVRQNACEFIYEGRLLKGVYSRNFELDGYTFISFESLLNRMGISSKDEEFISLKTVDKMKWIAKMLVKASEIAGAISYEECIKYVLDLSLVDCLVGNIDRHTRNLGLFYNTLEGRYEIPLVFDNGMGLFECDYYRDNYENYEAAMRTIYVSPYGEDPFDMIDILFKEFDMKSMYPGLAEIKYMGILHTNNALEYERRMLEHVRSKMAE